MRDIQIKTANIPFNCSVLGAKHKKQSELVFVRFVQKYISSPELDSTFLGQSFQECPEKNNCGIYGKLSNGKIGHDWSKCPAKQAYP